MRHPDAPVLAALPAWLSDLAQASAGEQPICVQELDRADPVVFDHHLTTVAAGACRQLAPQTQSLVSGATHDAHSLAAFCPTAMIFARCRGGISHHEDEYAEPSDLALGAQALSACLLDAAGGAVS
jgi:N-carbamoyl-L-amino-acid hydrolase